METATLTKAEEAVVKEGAEAFRQPEMQKEWEGWAKRSILHSREREKESAGKYRPREINLEDFDKGEREWMDKVADKVESRESSKESQSGREANERAEQRPEGEKPTPGETNNSAFEPIAAERYWQSKAQGAAKVESKDVADHWRRVNDGMAAVVVKYINEHPEKEQIAQGLKRFYADKSPEWVNAVEPDLFTALSEVPNPGEVFRHIALQPNDRDALRKVKNWQELRAAIQTISKHYGATSQASPKPSPRPRAPRPPSEVGGRGAATENANNFRAMEAEIKQQYAR